jgi:subtilisin family serine protease
MNSYCSKITATTLGALVGLAALAPAHAQEYKPGVLLVKTTTGGTQAAAVASALTAKGAAIVRQLSMPGWKVLKLGSDETVSEALVRVRKIDGVTAAEPDYIYRATATPNDTQYFQQYALNSISAPAAWDIGTGSEDVVVGVLDTGVSYNHEDLQANMWKNPGEIPNNGLDDDHNGWTDDVYGFDAVNQDGDPKDENGHGTHCSGILGARGNNSLGISGVNWRVKIMALRALGADGTGDTLAFVDALNYALDMKARGVNLRVINNSWGGLGASQVLLEVFQKSASAGIVNVCAAGNGGSDSIGDDNDITPHYPASYDVAGLISVAASDVYDNRGSFSNYGATSVDLAAPGVGILSTFLGGKSVYTTLSGTSMATPYVAGAAALFLSRAPDLTPTQVRNKIIKSCDVLDQWKGLVVSNGRLNIAKLFQQNGVYIIRGHVSVDNAGAKPIAGVSVFLNSNTGASAVTNANGDFSIGGLAAGSYTVKPVLEGWTLAPATTTVTLSATAHNVNLNFKGTASESTYSISGRVTQTVDGVTTVIPGASIYLNDDAEPLAVSDSSGNYIIRHRVAGTYTVHATKTGYNIISPKSGTQNVQVTLPVSAQTPNATINFKASILDTSAPIVAISRPLGNESIQEGIAVRFEGRVTDDTGVTEAQFYLRDVLGQYYNWRTGVMEFPSVDSFRVISYKTPVKSANFTFQAAGLPVGIYGLYSQATDTLGNQDDILFPTVFDVVSSAGAPTVWPTVAITSPKGGASIPAGPPVTVKGTFDSSDLVAAIYLRILRYDEYGRVLGAWDWTQGKFITDTTQLTTYKKIPQSTASGAWQYTLPSLPAGAYAVNAFGRSVVGNEPPPGRSDDARVKFTYGGTTTTTASAATSVKDF